MEFSREKLRQIRRLMVLAAALVLGVIYSGRILVGVRLFYEICRLFVFGAVAAFVLNIPMRALEKRVLRGWNGKLAKKCKRPVCMILSVLFVGLAVTAVVGTVVPQVTATAAEVGAKIPGFMRKLIVWLDQMTRDEPVFAEQIDKLKAIEINWDAILNSIVDFLKNGAADMLNSTVSIASGIISGIVNTFISFIFALYILAQKEKLGDQGKRIVTAYLPPKASAKVLEVCSLLYRNFSSYIAGQCVEAVILGTMFFIAMSIFRLPYALLVGVLICFTALIPIVGAFIGCGVGTFLILIENPLQAVWFVVLFLVLQQLEGNLIYPRVVGSSVGLPSIWVLMAVSVGGSLFGIAGMLAFIPLTATAYSLFRDSVNRRNASRGIPARAPENAEEEGKEKL